MTRLYTYTEACVASSPGRSRRRRNRLGSELHARLTAATCTNRARTPATITGTCQEQKNMRLKRNSRIHVARRSLTSITRRHFTCSNSLRATTYRNVTTLAIHFSLNFFFIFLFGDIENELRTREDLEPLSNVGFRISSIFQRMFASAPTCFVRS